MHLVKNFLKFSVIALIFLIFKKSYGIKINIADLSLPKELYFCGEKVPLEDAHVREMLEREFLLSLFDIPQVLLWIKRSKRYFPYIEKKLKEYNLPDDLKYIAIAESSLKIYAYSRSGAVGIWQFIKSTAKKYGLKVNRYIDERYDFYASTEAALKYLKDLYDEFGSWTLAVAAYNCGEKRMEREIDEQQVSDYYKLNLPLETERYIFRILAAKIILENSKKYGYNLDEDQLYSEEKFVEVEIKNKLPIHLRVIAEAANTYFKVIKELNPQILGYYLLPGKHKIRIPFQDKKKFYRNYKRLIKTKLAESEKASIYIVKKGDTLSLIGKKLNVSVRKLRAWNRLKSDIIYPGQILRFYKKVIK